MLTRVIVSALLTVLMVVTAATCEETEEELRPEDYTVNVVVPNGGEIWAAGTFETVVWELNSDVVPDSIRIRLLRKPASESAAKSAPTTQKKDPVLTTIRGDNPGKWEWEKVGPVGNGMKIQVEAFFPKKTVVKDASDGDFAIVAPEITSEFARPSLRVVSPNGGEVWTVGSKRTVKWATEPVPAVSESGGTVTQPFLKRSRTVRISLSRDGGVSWRVLADGLEHTAGAWEWTVTDAVSDKCRLRVALFDRELTEICQDDSDADFRVIPSDMTVPRDKTRLH